MKERRGVFPGSFDPLTVAHLAVAEAAVAQCDLDELHLAISMEPLGKDRRQQSDAADRVAAIEAAARTRPWLRATVTSAALVADIASGFDVVVVGADKWLQLHDPAFYGGSADAVRRALRRLPELAVAPRAGVLLPPDVPVLAVDPQLAEVSSSAVRAGRREWRA